MNSTYRINAQFAISKALEAVRSWEQSLEEVQAANNAEGIAFCEASLKVCRENLALVREDVKNVHMWS